MRYLLDTNTCIRYINGRAPKLRLKLPTIPMADVVVCDIVVAELFYGAAKSNTPTESLAKQQAFLQPYVSLLFDGKAAIQYGLIRAQLEKQGTPIGALDMLIAAIVLANGLILVTHNTDEFRRVSDLKIED